MATKTFKIGLSNAEKQAMAQAIYERVLDLTFPEYDTSETYAVGDFVVYNDQLYKCIGATSGAWDSTKWQLATLNDLLTDIESAVAFVNDKANVDGNYPTMTVGVADQLSPYDEESGDDQDEPFSFQATGTGNGSQQDFATGIIALMKEKQGNSVVVNQLASASGNNVSNYICTCTKTGSSSQWFGFNNVPNIVDGHKYYIMVSKLTGTIPSSNSYLLVGGEPNRVNLYTYPNGNIITISSHNNLSYGLVLANDIEQGTTISFDLRIIDLTQWFNGDIPQDLLDNPENFFRYYQGSLAYNTGELVNANGGYIKCIGRNQFDGTNDIKVVPNSTYYIYGSATLTYKDKDGNTISSESKSNETFDVPANCLSVGVSGSGNICISLYYEGESGYDQYYPYEVLTNTDTGTETLRSAGSVKDYKTPDGTIHRLVGSVDLGTLTWSQYTSDGVWYSNAISDCKAVSSNGDEANVVSNKYVSASRNDVYAKSNANIIGIDTSSRVVVYNANGSNSPTGILYYELATPTTEQGTLFSENLVIDDFGSMDFSGTSGVPQGNLIFYPVDYKAFIDTLYDYTEGTPSYLALKSDLSADKTELQGVDTQLQNAIGGTLRQLLASSQSVDFLNTAFKELSECDWTASSTTLFHSSSLNGQVKAQTGAKILCTIYKTVNDTSSLTNDTIVIAQSFAQTGITSIVIKTASTYDDATAFKNAMKGVLLAYEKASE